MNISFVGPDPAEQGSALARLLALARHLQRRGDQVRVYVERAAGYTDETLPVVVASLAEAPPAHWLESDVYVYHDAAPRALLESVKQVRGGVVIWLCHTPDDPSLIHYADLCVVTTPKLREQLNARLGYPPERIFVLPDIQTPEDEERYGEQWRSMVDRAAHDDLPQASLPAARTEPARPARAQPLELQADIMLRGYVVRSRAPVIGGWIAWVRRNLTSHLREPYLDPILERQVALNRRLVREIRESKMIQDEILQRLTRLEARLNCAPASDDRPVKAPAEESGANIEIRDPALDRAAILERVRAQVAQRRAASGYGPAPETLEPESLRPPHVSERMPSTVSTTFPDLDRDLVELMAHSRLREPQFTSRTPVLGLLIVALRRWWNWMSTRWYVLPLAGQQSEINARTAVVIGQVAQWQEINAQSVVKLQTHLTELQDRVAALEKRETLP